MVLLFAVGLVVAACSGDTTEPTTTPAPTTATPPATPAATTSTTTMTTTTTTTTMSPTMTTIDPLARPDVLVSNVNRDSIEDFDTSKDNIYEAAMELLDLFAFLEGNPTDDANEMVSLIFERDYPYWNPILVSFLELTDNPGWRYVDPGIELIAIDVVNLDDETATVEVVDRREYQEIADEDGNTVRTYDGWPQRLSSFTFHRGVDGLWRFADATPSVEVGSNRVDDMVPVVWEGRTG